MWDNDTDQCLTWDEWKEIEKQRCKDEGNKWNQDGWCEYRMAHRMHILQSRISGSVDIGTVSDILQPLVDNEEKQQKLSGELFEKIGKTLEQYGDKFEKLDREARELNEAAGRQLEDYLGQVIKINGTPLN